MNKPVFFKVARGLSLAEIAQITGASAPAGFTCTIGNVAPLDRAGPGDLSFFDQRRYLSAAAATHASACLTSEALAKELPPSVAVLVVAAPFAAFIAVARALFPDALRPSSLYHAGTNAGAHVHVEARLESGVTVEPGAVVGPRAEIGSGTVISATAVIGPEVRIGRDCSIGAGAVITNALLGDRVIIHPGCTIGKDGFGFIVSGGRHMKVPQIGRVIIQDDVEIGASTTVDRGALRDTVIGEGTKIDNQVQVGHNVSIGRHCILVAQVGISGSATLDDYVVLGARVGVNNNARIGEGAQIAALSSATGNVPAGARWGGTPAKPIKYWLREMRMVARLARKGGAEAAADE